MAKWFAGVAELADALDLGSNPRCLIEICRLYCEGDIFFAGFAGSKYGYCMIYNLCGCGGIGRRARFRF